MASCSWSIVASSGANGSSSDIGSPLARSGSCWRRTNIARSAVSCFFEPAGPAQRKATMSELHRLLDEARELLPAAVALRRRIHAEPELGLDLPLTTAAVLEGLQGLDVEIARGPSTSGLMVSLAGTKPGTQTGRTILLRGDMDALPMPEETGLDFASKIPGRMHACGH